MIIDATKINYFEDPPRSAYDRKALKKQSKKEDTGVILDASTKRTESKNKKRNL